MLRHHYYVVLMSCPPAPCTHRISLPPKPFDKTRLRLRKLAIAGHHIGRPKPNGHWELTYRVTRVQRTARRRISTGRRCPAADSLTRGPKRRRVLATLTRISITTKSTARPPGKIHRRVSFCASGYASRPFRRRPGGRVFPGQSRPVYQNQRQLPGADARRGSGKPGQPGQRFGVG